MPSDKSRERLVVTMEGLPLHSGDIPVSAFVSVVQGLQALMRRVAERQTGKKGGGMDFLISNLSHSSPASVEIVPDGASAIAGRIVADAESILMCIAKGDVENIPAPEYDAIEALVAPYKKKKLSVATIQRMNGAAPDSYPPVVMDEGFVKNLVRGREGELRGMTAVSGIVEKLDLHSSPIKLTIYPQIGGPVVWYLPGNAEDKALEAIGKRVTVTGDARYRPDADNPGIQRPYRIDAGADKVEILPPYEDAWRRLKELRGAFPDLTGGKDTIEYLRELRGENN